MTKVIVGYLLCSPKEAEKIKFSTMLQAIKKKARCW